MLAYLSVQESADFDSLRPENRGQLPEFIGTLLSELGKRLRARFSICLLGRRAVIQADPFIHLRGIYLHCLRLQRDKRLGFLKRSQHRVLIVFHRAAFRTKMLAFVLIGRLYAKKMLRLFRQNDVSWLSERNIQNYLRLVLRNVVPNSGHLSREQWGGIINECAQFLSARVRHLLEVIPSHSIKDDGLAKLLKVAVGVLAGRAARMTQERPSPDYITNSFKLAYCWGITYPLIDNILDSNSQTNDDKRRLHHVIQLLFNSDGTDLSAARHAAVNTSPLAVELVSCFEIVFENVECKYWQGTQRVLQLLLESHWRDSMRHLSACDESKSGWEEVWIDTVLKAALVRWATMEICGIKVTDEAVRSGIASAPFNQLGDDMLDVLEDEKEGRVTPFTLHRQFPSLPDPTLLYFAAASSLRPDKSDRQGEAALLGVCEVVADCYRSGALPKDIAERIAKYDPQFALTLKSAFRVDPDTVLFSFGRILNAFIP